MSEVAAAVPVATEPAPQPTPTPEIVETPAGVPEAPQPRTAPEVRQAAKQDVKQRFQESRGVAAEPQPDVTLDAEGKAHGPDGKYVQKPQAEVPPPEAAPAETVPATASDAETVAIPIPEGHALREQGRTELVVPKAQERDIRTLLNSGARRQDVQAAKKAEREARRIAAERDAEAKFWQENSGTIFGPEFYQVYNDILNTEGYGKEHAERYKAGILAQVQERLTAQRQEAAQAFDASVAQETAQRFRDVAVRDAIEGLPGQQPTFPGWTMEGTYGLRAALEAYGAILDARFNRGEQAEPEAAQWRALAKTFYDNHPAGKAQRDAERKRLTEAARTQAETEAEAAQRKALEDAANRHGTNALGNLPPVRTPSRSIPEPTGVDLAGKTPSQIRKNVFQSIVGRERRR